MILTKRQVTVARYAIFELPAAVAEHRAKRGQSLRAAAAEISVGFAEFHRFEGGAANPTLTTILKYLDYLDT